MLGLRTWWHGCGVASPHQHCALCIDGQAVRLDNFGFQIFEEGVIQVELALERPVGG
jgi:hypothetical protein